MSKQRFSYRLIIQKINDPVRDDDRLTRYHGTELEIENIELTPDEAVSTMSMLAKIREHNR